MSQHLHPFICELGWRPLGDTIGMYITASTEHTAHSEHWRSCYLGKGLCPSGIMS